MSNVGPGPSALVRALASAAILALVGLLGCSAPLEAAQGTALVSMPAAGAVELVDLATGRVLTHTVVGKLPHNLLPAPDGKSVFVSLVGSQAIAEVDAATGRLRRTFLSEPVPKTRKDGSVIQEHIDEDAFSATSCYACHNTIIGSRPFGMAFSEDKSELFVTNIRSGNLSTIDLASGAIRDLVHMPAEGEVHEATGIARLGDALFVSVTATQPSSQPALLRRLDAESLMMLSESETGPDAPVLLADPSRQQLYASNRETNTVSRFDAQGHFVGTLTVGNSPIGLVLSKDQKKLVVANFYDGTVSVVDLASGSSQQIELALGQESFANPTHLALSADGRYAYVVSAAPKQGYLLQLDLSSHRVLRAIPVGGLGYDIAILPVSPIPRQP